MTQSVKVLRLTQMQSAQRLRLTQIPPMWKQKKRLKVVLIAVAPGCWPGGAGTSAGAGGAGGGGDDDDDGSGNNGNRSLARPRTPLQAAARSAGDQQTPGDVEECLR